MKKFKISKEKILSGAAVLIQYTDIASGRIEARLLSFLRLTVVW